MNLESEEKKLKMTILRNQSQGDYFDTTQNCGVFLSGLLNYFFSQLLNKHGDI